MKKILAIAVVLMMVPLSAYALEMLTEDVMDDVTGQAGVSIAVDDVKIFQSIDYLRYYDDDGLTDPLGLGNPTGDGASVGISNLTMMIHINAITDLDSSGLPTSPGRALQGTYSTAYDFTNFTTTAGDVFTPRALTIDATQALPVLSNAMANKATNLGATLATTDVAGVQIGLPTVEINQSAISFEVTVGDAPGSINGTGGAGVSLADNSYGTILVGGQNIAILDGTLEIAPH
jgi:hypothetical protein